MAPKKNRVICLIGMDGSGKTTHALKIISHIQKSGTKCKYVWFGAPYILSYPFMILCRILGLTKMYYLANNLTCSEHQYYRNKPVSVLWPWIQFVDVAFLANIRVRLALWRGFTVICDRFIPDTLVELMTDTRNQTLYRETVGRLMLELMPKPLLMFNLNIDEKTAWQRKNDVPEMNYLILRRKAYFVLCNALKIPLVDARKPAAVAQKNLIIQIDEN